jgi:hypothetical protein
MGTVKRACYSVKQEIEARGNREGCDYYFDDSVRKDLESIALEIPVPQEESFGIKPSQFYFIIPNKGNTIGCSLSYSESMNLGQKLRQDTKLEISSFTEKLPNELIAIIKKYHFKKCVNISD